HADRGICGDRRRRDGAETLSRRGRKPRGAQGAAGGAPEGLAGDGRRRREAGQYAAVDRCRRFRVRARWRALPARTNCRRNSREGERLCCGSEGLMRPMRIAIIGYGKIAEDQHIPSIAGNPRFELAAVSSRSGQGPQPVFTDWREMIHKVEGLDAVAITTPPSPRYDIARECIRNDLHCLLEKPPSDGLSEVADLDLLAQTHGVSLFTTWHAQHHSTVELAERALAGKRIKSMKILWHEDVHKWHPGQTWIWDPGGFGVFDPGINAFSIATKIFPGSLLVRNATLSVPENAQTPIAVDITFAS